MYNFFIDSTQINKEENTAIITNEDVNHIANVLRMKVSDEIIVCNTDNNKRYLTSICEIKNDYVKCKLIEELENTEMTAKITLFQGLPKREKFEFIIQKMVELGVYNIYPVDMKNCIMKIKDEEKKNARWQEIAKAAAKQSKRTIIPEIKHSITFKNMLEEINNYDLVLLAYENENKDTIKQVLHEIDREKINTIGIIIGPEGGISDSELEELLKKENVKSVSLGRRILRTETAAIAIQSILGYELDM